MKKSALKLLTFLLIIPIFTISSCKELCETKYDHQFNGDVTTVVFQDGQPLGNVTVNYQYTKVYCNGASTFVGPYSSVTDANGIAPPRGGARISLLNDFDKAIVTVECLGLKQSAVIDYNYFNDDAISQHLYIPSEFIFNL